QHAPGDDERAGLAGFELLLRLLAVRGVQLGRQVLALEVVGERGAGLAQLRELGAPLRDNLVLVLGGVPARALVFDGHVSRGLYVRGLAAVTFRIFTAPGSR